MNATVGVHPHARHLLGHTYAANIVNCLSCSLRFSHNPVSVEVSGTAMELAHSGYGDFSTMKADVLLDKLADFFTELVNVLA